MELSFRSLIPEDYEELKILHNECFPIKYSDSFYYNAVRGFWLKTGKPLFTLVIESKNENNKEKYFVPSSNENLKKSLLAAVLIAQIILLEKIEDKYLIEPNDKITQAIYILTIGSKSCCRRKGYATSLLKECIKYGKTIKNCGAIYLHVMSNNYKGIEFYKKNGFICLRRLRDYYIIENKKYDAYIFIYYINGCYQSKSLYATMSITYEMEYDEQKKDDLLNYEYDNEFIPINYTCNGLNRMFLICERSISTVWTSVSCRIKTIYNKLLQEKSEK